MRAALAELGVDLDRHRAMSSPTPRSAMAASAGSPPASWRAWRRVRSPRTATASATITACSARRSRTAGRSNCPRTGSTSAIRGSSSGAEATYRGRLRRHGRNPAQERTTRRAMSGSRPKRSSPSPTTRRSSAGAGKRVNTLRLWSARADRSDPARRIQPRRPHRRARRAHRAERHLARALSRRCDAGRPGAAAAPGVLLHLGLAAGHRPAPPAASTATSASLPDKAAIQLNDTHPGDRRRRADAPPDRRARARLGTRPGSITTRHHRLHQPHAAARGARELAGAAVRAAAAAPHADRLRRSTPAALEARRASPQFDGAPLAASVADRRERRPPRPHGLRSPSSARTRSTASRRCTPS